MTQYGEQHKVNEFWEVERIGNSNSMLFTGILSYSRLITFYNPALQSLRRKSVEPYIPIRAAPPIPSLVDISCPQNARIDTPTTNRDRLFSAYKIFASMLLVCYVALFYDHGVSSCWVLCANIRSTGMLTNDCGDRVLLPIHLKYALPTIKNTSMIRAGVTIDNSDNIAAFLWVHILLVRCVLLGIQSIHGSAERLGLTLIALVHDHHLDRSRMVGSHWWNQISTD
jgi:hypothetical protein